MEEDRFESERISKRQEQHKAAINPDDGRRKREQKLTSIRKDKRHDALNSKRRQRSEDSAASAAAPVDTPAAAAAREAMERLSSSASSSMASSSSMAVPSAVWPSAAAPSPSPMPVYAPAPVQPGQMPYEPSTIEKLQHIPAMMQDLISQDQRRQLHATQLFRKLLSIERNPPINEVIQCSAVPYFVYFLSRDDQPQLQFEALWALTNIASGTSDHTRVVIDGGAVPHFVRLLRSPHDDVREQAVWALGNIAGDSPACRDMLLAENVVQPLLENLQPRSRVSMLRNGTWTLSNLCRGRPAPPFEIVRPALRPLARLLHETDVDVLTDTCWALSYLSDGTNDKIQAVIETGCVPTLVSLLSHANANVQTPALRTIGNIVTGDDVQTQTVIEAGALPLLLSLLHSQRRSIRKEACWALSNITAGNRDQIERVIAYGIMPPLIEILRADEFEIRKEACWAISNATSGGSPEQLGQLVAFGCLGPLCSMLESPEDKILMVALEGIENILRAGSTESTEDGPFSSRYTSAVFECGGVERIEALQQHSSVDIFNKSYTILTSFFPFDEDEGPQDDGSLSFPASSGPSYMAAEPQ